MSELYICEYAVTLCNTRPCMHRTPHQNDGVSCQKMHCPKVDKVCRCIRTESKLDKLKQMIREAR